MTPSWSGAQAEARARLGGAIVVSIALHAVALEALTQAPRGWQAGAWSPSGAATGRMRATLRPAMPGIEATPPEAFFEPPAPPQASEETETQAPEPEPAAVASSVNDGEDRRSVEPETEQDPAELPSASVLAAPFYYPANQLDERPQIEAEVEPGFPSGAAATRGRVVLRLYIGAHGEVEKITVVEADPAGIFEKSALDAFAAARFSPGIKNGVPVRSLLTIEVRFGVPAPQQSVPRY